VRGVLAERVAVSILLDPYMTLRGAGAYTGLSVKTLRRAVNDTPDQALPCYRVGTAILVRRSEVDTWLAQRRTVGRPSLVRALREMGLAPA
jgi:excisionase family DNA binding protein